MREDPDPSPYSETHLKGFDTFVTFWGHFCKGELLWFVVCIHTHSTPSE